MAPSQEPTPVRVSPEPSESGSLPTSTISPGRLISAPTETAPGQDTGPTKGLPARDGNQPTKLEPATQQTVAFNLAAFREGLQLSSGQTSQPTASAPPTTSQEPGEVKADSQTGTTTDSQSATNPPDTSSGALLGSPISAVSPDVAAAIKESFQEQGDSAFITGLGMEQLIEGDFEFSGDPEMAFAPMTDEDISAMYDPDFDICDYLYDEQPSFFEDDTTFSNSACNAEFSTEVFELSEDLNCGEGNVNGGYLGSSVIADEQGGLTFIQSGDPSTPGLELVAGSFQLEVGGTLDETLATLAAEVARDVKKKKEAQDECDTPGSPGVAGAETQAEAVRQVVAQLNIDLGRTNLVQLQMRGPVDNLFERISTAEVIAATQTKDDTPNPILSTVT